jgi:hypothetical protein
MGLTPFIFRVDDLAETVHEPAEDGTYLRGLIGERALLGHLDHGEIALFHDLPSDPQCPLPKVDEGGNGDTVPIVYLMGPCALTISLTADVRNWCKTFLISSELLLWTTALMTVHHQMVMASLAMFSISSLVNISSLSCMPIPPRDDSLGP